MIQHSLLALSLVFGSTAALADSTTIKYETVSKPLKVCATVQNTNSPLGLSRTSDELLATATLVWDRTVVIETYSNDTVEGTGKSEYWDAFYSASSRGERITILKKAIVGIGDTLAPLVYPYFFGDGIKKPKSWKQFSDRINAAADGIELSTCYGKKDGCITAKSWVNNVLKENGKKNRINLGYQIENTPVVTTETVHQTGSLPAPSLNKKLFVAYTVSGLSLLPGECESFTIAYDGEQVSLSSNQNYNAITESKQSTDAFGGMQAIVSFAGNGRKQVGARGLVSASLSGTNAILSRSNELANYSTNAEFAAKCKIQGNFSVAGVTPKGWCSEDKRSLASVTGRSIENASSIELGSWTLKDKEQAVMDASFNFEAACPFFNSRAF